MSLFKHPKTSLPGAAMVLVSFAVVVAHLLGHAHSISLTDAQALVTALGGAGLLGASDGSM